MINDDIKNFPTLIISWHTIDFNALVVTEERIASGTGLPLGDTDGVIVVQEDQPRPGEYHMSPHVPYPPCLLVLKFGDGSLFLSYVFGDLDKLSC